MISSSSCFFPSLFLTRYRRVWRMVVRVDRKGRQPTGGVPTTTVRYPSTITPSADVPRDIVDPRSLILLTDLFRFLHSISYFSSPFVGEGGREKRAFLETSSSIIFQTCFVSKRRPFPTCCCRCYCCYYYRSREKIVTRLGSGKFLIALSGSRSTYSALFARRDF